MREGVWRVMIRNVLWWKSGEERKVGQRRAEEVNGAGGWWNTC